ncbi:MAG: hypothetical protein JXA97_06635 [Anaerolineales bacterium]|nr:hypothetical protein [Anaerolineales bacterium]
MRGIPISTKLQKADVVILAAHWDRETGNLKTLRLVERRGKVWGSSISQAPEIVAAGIHHQGSRVYTAEALQLPGDFRLIARVEAEDGALVMDGKKLTPTVLGLPIY